MRNWTRFRAGSPHSGGENEVFSDHVAALGCALRRMLRLGWLRVPKLLSAQLKINFHGFYSSPRTDNGCALYASNMTSKLRNQ